MGNGDARQQHWENIFKQGYKLGYQDGFIPSGGLCEFYGAAAGMFMMGVRYGVSDQLTKTPKNALNAYERYKTNRDERSPHPDVAVVLRGRVVNISEARED